VRQIKMAIKRIETQTIEARIVRLSEKAKSNKVEELLLNEILIRQKQLKPSIWKKKKSQQ
jgi:hypothetical protein